MVRHVSAVVAGVVVLTTTARSDEIAKLLADDGDVLDRFGFAVAIDGSTAVVGAPWNDDNGNDSGSAYLFDATTGVQILKLLPDDGSEDDRFGLSVAISGTTILVGAPYDSDDGVFAGSAYLFDAATGEQTAKLVPGDPADGGNFGSAVAVDDGVAVVGARGDDINGEESGAAYLFDVSSGRQLATLLPPDGQAFGRFGSAVDIRGAIAIVGAFESDYHVNSGTVHLFDVPTGRRILELVPDDPVDGSKFGSSVAIDGAFAVVGAHLDGEAGVLAGAAYLFDLSTGRQIAKMLADDGSASDFFGDSIDISGDLVFIGARGGDDNQNSAGSAYVFDTTGRQLEKILPCDGSGNDAFGISVALSGVTAIAGAYYDYDNGAASGSAYLLDVTPGPPCDGDTDGNGIVDIDDLINVILDYGTDGSTHNGNLDACGLVDMDDVDRVLRSFGPCP